MVYHILNHLLYELFPLSPVYMLKTMRFGDRIGRSSQAKYKVTSYSQSSSNSRVVQKLQIPYLWPEDVKPASPRNLVYLFFQYRTIDKSKWFQN